MLFFAMNSLDGLRNFTANSFYLTKETPQRDTKHVNTTEIKGEREEKRTKEMRRRRFDSESDEDEARTAPLPSVIIKAVPVSTSPNNEEICVAEVPTTATFGFGAGTLFSKGKRTQFATDLAKRVEHGQLGGDNAVHTTNAPSLTALLLQHDEFVVGRQGTAEESDTSLQLNRENNSDAANIRIDADDESGGLSSSSVGGTRVRTSLLVKDRPTTTSLPASRGGKGLLEVPLGLTTIRSYINRGLQPKMNMRIDDDERCARGGVLLPISQQQQLAKQQEQHQSPSSPATVVSPLSPSSPSSAAGGRKNAAVAGRENTLLTIHPFISDRVNGTVVEGTQSSTLRDVLAKTVATTGPIPMTVWRSLKRGPSPDRSRGERDDERKGEDETEKPPNRSRGGLRVEGGGDYGRGQNTTTGRAAGHRYADEATPEITRHLDVGGGGLQHPFFNAYCSNVLSKVSVAFDVAVTAEAVEAAQKAGTGLFSPTSPTEQASSGGENKLSAAGKVPALTVLSHSLATRDVLETYCGGEAPTSTKPSSLAASHNGQEGGAAASSVAAKQSLVGSYGGGLAHTSSSTKPHEYAVADVYGGMQTSVRSGWRWDGIVRGNPNVLAKYSIN